MASPNRRNRRKGKARLPPPVRAAIRNNPHAAQLAAPAWQEYAEATLHPPGELPRTLDASSPRMEYRRRPLRERSAVHWGQLKLMAVEVEFLTEFAAAEPGREWLVVYAGAAPGDHIPALAGLFPNCRFVLYDPAAYCKALADHPHERIAVFREFFTEAVAARFAGRDDVLFISDIRTCTTPPPVGESGVAEGEEDPEVQADVRADMARQAEWVRAIRPVASMLKCRFPWDAGTTTYLAGEVRLQPYCPTASTETRLVVTREDVEAEPATYDNREHEERMMYHNAVGRVRLYDHGLPDGVVPGLDHCYDCAATAGIFRDYLAATGGAPDAAAVARLCARTLDSFSGRRTLATRAPVSTSKTASEGRFRRRDYTGDKLTYLDDGKSRGKKRRRGRRGRGRGGRGHSGP